MGYGLGYYKFSGGFSFLISPYVQDYPVAGT